VRADFDVKMRRCVVLEPRQ